MIRTLLLSGALLLLSIPAYAVTITGGNLQIGTSNFGTLTLLGDNFSFSSGVFDAPVSACQICAPGAQLGANDGHVGPLNGSFLVPSGPGPTGSLLFTLDSPWVVPTQLIQPFTMTGSLNGVSLNGVGLATLELSGGGALFQRTGLLYQFTNVPEPATYFLLATGLVGFALIRWKLNIRHGP